MCLVIKQSFKDSPPPSRTTVYKVFTLQTEDDGGRSLCSPIFGEEILKEYQTLKAYNHFFNANGDARKIEATKRAFLRLSKSFDTKINFDNREIMGGAIHCFIGLESAVESYIFRNPRGVKKRVVVQCTVRQEDWIADGKHNNDACYLKVNLNGIVAANRNCLLK